MILLANAFLLWRLGKTYASVLSHGIDDPFTETKGSPDVAVNWSEILKHYIELKTLATSINKAIGTMVTVYIVEFVLIHSVGLDDIFQYGGPGSWRRIVNFTFFVCSASLIFYISSDINCQV